MLQYRFNEKDYGDWLAANWKWRVDENAPWEEELPDGRGLKLYPRWDDTSRVLPEYRLDEGEKALRDLINRIHESGWNENSPHTALSHTPEIEPDEGVHV